MTLDEFWELVNHGLEPPPEPRERRLADVRSRIEEFEDDPERGEALAAEIRTAIEEHRVDWPTQPRPHHFGDQQSTSAYWRLLEELDEAELAVNPRVNPAAAARWKPFELEDWTPWWAFEETGVRLPHLTIGFDHRMSQRDLVYNIRSLWPRLARAGLVRQTRPLRRRAIALVRLVCLEQPPGATWKARMAAWNCSAEVPDRYVEVRLFQRDFRRAERQLTGFAYGLEHIYNPVARLPEKELRALSDAGDPRAVLYLGRLSTRDQRRRELNKSVERNWKSE